MSNSIELKLLRPQLVSFSVEQEREAIALLAELLLEVASNRRAGASSGALVSASGSGSGSVVAFPGSAGKARKAA